VSPGGIRTALKWGFQFMRDLNRNRHVFQLQVVDAGCCRPRPPRVWVDLNSTRQRHVPKGHECCRLNVAKTSGGLAAKGDSRWPSRTAEFAYDDVLVGGAQPAGHSESRPAFRQSASSSCREMSACSLPARALTNRCSMPSVLGPRPPRCCGHGPRPSTCTMIGVADVDGPEAGAG